MKNVLVRYILLCLFFNCFVLNSFADDSIKDKTIKAGNLEDQKAVDSAMKEMVSAWKRLRDFNKNNEEFEKGLGEKIEVLWNLKHKGIELAEKIKGKIDSNDQIVIMIFIKNADIATQLTNACLYMFYMHIPTSDNEALNGVVMHYFKYAIEQLDGIENEIQRMLSKSTHKSIIEYGDEIYSNILLSKRILQDFQLKMAKNPYEIFEDTNSNEK